jgi:uncharacterized protein (DUF1499 family)
MAQDRRFKRPPLSFDTRLFRALTAVKGVLPVLPSIRKTQQKSDFVNANRRSVRDDDR